MEVLFFLVHQIEVISDLPFTLNEKNADHVYKFQKNQ